MIVSTSINFITIPKQRFFLEANCHKVLEKLSDLTNPNMQMYSSTSELKKLFSLSEVFKNTDELYCPML